LPKCLRDPDKCAGTFDSVGLHCAGCGACPMAGLSADAEELGYTVVIAEGTSSVIMKVLEGEADAILGVACLDSLEKSFATVSDLGVPNQAIPLLYDGCVSTEAEIELIAEALRSSGGSAEQATRSALPLMRETVAIFDEANLARTLEPHLRAGDDPLAATDGIALEWLREGGKRLRPFVTVASYAVARYGWAALEAGADVQAMVPDCVRRLAVAIETLHKASLVHDDIEDDDPFRYGRPTLHRTWGTGAAINVGDQLVGLGYRLIAGEADDLGPACVADILGRLSEAHLELCRGQGAELLWNRCGRDLHPVDALAIAARKTAPAFEAAIYAGLRAAEADVPEDLLRRFSVYLGEAYQALNDLQDWQSDRGNKVSLGRDVLAGRPTVLRAFAIEAGGDLELAALAARARDEAEVVEAVRRLYEELGAFDKAERLVAGLRERALAAAGEFGREAGLAQPAALAELMQLLVRIVLRRRVSDAR
ncbi:MAG TPA: polyprenyl synthetase family protein, partial [Armatimonadota bacterium]|nr:polyprenyl synthetase family protein [Armatimonadota bacterium]